MKNFVTLCLVLALVCIETELTAMLRRTDSQKTLVSEGDRSVELIEIIDNSSSPREASLFDNDINSIRICVERGDDVNMDNLRCGTTPLTNATKNGNEEIVNYLLNNGADPSLKGWRGTPISLARRCQESAENEEERAKADQIVEILENSNSYSVNPFILLDLSRFFGF